IEPSTLNAMRLLRAYALVLARVYSIDLDLDYSFIFSVADPDTGLDRHFKAQFDLRFVEVVPVGPTPPLTDEDRRRLHGNLLDRDFLLAILPPEKFVFRGFTILKAVEVTDQEVLSSLKRRSEERRVGKECRSRWGRCHEKEKRNKTRERSASWRQSNT